MTQFENVEVTSTLTVGDASSSGRTDMFGPVTITNGNCSYTNDLVVNGSLAIDQSFFSGNAVISGTMNVQDQLNVDNVLAVTGNIQSSGNMLLGGDMSLGGKLDATSLSSTNLGASVVTLNTLTVNQVSTLADVICNNFGALSVDTENVQAETLTVGGNSTLAAVTAKGIDCLNLAAPGVTAGTLTVTGNTTAGLVTSTVTEAQSIVNSYVFAGENLIINDLVLIKNDGTGLAKVFRYTTDDAVQNAIPFGIMLADASQSTPARVITGGFANYKAESPVTAGFYLSPSTIDPGKLKGGLFPGALGGVTPGIALNDAVGGGVGQMMFCQINPGYAPTAPSIG